MGFSPPKSRTKAPLWLRAAALSGFTVTLLSCVLAMFPIVDVTSWLSFGLKVGGVILIANLAGAAIYLARPKPAAAVAASVNRSSD